MMIFRIRLAFLLLALTGCVSPPPAAPPVLATPPEKPSVEIVPMTIPPENPVERPVERPEEGGLTIGTQLRIFQETGDAEKARLAVESQVGLSSLTVVDRSAYAGLLMAEGRFAEAKKSFEEVLVLNPTDKDSLLSLAYLAFGEKDFPRQLLFLERLLKAHPQDPEALAAMGLYYYAQEKPDRAEGSFRQSLKQKDNSDAREGLARLALDGKNWKDALENLDAGLVLDPRRDSLLSLRSRAQEGLENFPEAEADLTKALEISPANPWHLLDRARLRWRELYKPDGALQDLETILASDPGNFFALVYRGEINENRDNAAEAYTDLKKALEIRPDYRFAYPSLTMLSFQNKDWESAQKYALKSWPLHQGEYAFPWIAVLSLRNLGRQTEAKAILEQAYKQYGSQPLIQEMCRFLITPAVAFALDDGLAKEKSRVVQIRLKFYQGYQYKIMNRPAAARALWEEVSAQTLRNIPEIRMAKAFLAELP